MPVDAVCKYLEDVFPDSYLAVVREEAGQGERRFIFEIDVEDIEFTLEVAEDFFAAHGPTEIALELAKRGAEGMLRAHPNDVVILTKAGWKLGDES